MFFWLVRIFFWRAKWGEIAIVFGNTIYASNRLQVDIWEHELIHVRQQRYVWWGGVIWWIGYTFSKRYRYRMELEAYRRQLNFVESLYNKDRADLLAKRIAEVMSSKRPYGRLGKYSRILKDLTKNN